jgi:hypothetical protein
MKAQAVIKVIKAKVGSIRYKSARLGSVSQGKSDYSFE